MNITTEKTDNTCVLRVEGEIDTVTSPQLEQAIADNAGNCDKMILDMTGVGYISSAGLRVIIAAHRQMQKKDGLVLKGLSKNVKSVFSLTGFDRVLHIEE